MPPYRILWDLQEWCSAKPHNLGGCGPASSLYQPPQVDLILARLVAAAAAAARRAGMCILQLPADPVPENCLL